MNPAFRQALIYTGISLGSVWIAWQLADGSYFWPSFALLVAICAILVRIFRLPADIIILGLVTFGYLVGNRGFAQLMPSPYVPLLPAETALLFAGSWALIACAFERRLPWRYDALNWCALAWLVLGAARLVFDVRTYGLNAIRDSATVYYALFFFLAQRAARDPKAREYLLLCCVAGLCLIPVLNALYEAFPDFFFEYLRINGVPVILYKGDLAYMFVAVGSVLLFHWATGPQRYWLWPYTVVMFLTVMARESRASILGSLVVVLLLATARRWLYPVVQTVAVVLAFAVVLAAATLLGNSWAGEKLDDVHAHLYSIVDPVAAVNRQADTSAYKWDNNRFRLVWWKNVVLETWETNPVFGLGFGHDLARGFLQEYQPEAGDDFTARSPHNVALTAFGRMGVLGLAVWLGLCASLAACTWRSLRRDPRPERWGLWCGVTIIVVAATFGVVLEGPMAAVPFWIMLGLAHTEADPPETATGAAPEKAVEPASLIA